MIFTDLLRPFLFPVLEVGIEYHAVKAYPEHIDDFLRDQHTGHLPVCAEEKIGVSIDGFPCDIERQRSKRHGVGFLLDTKPDAFLIDDNPTDAREQSQKNFHGEFLP